ncbi:hypothetical protein LCGC14_0262570 [marine sediment metagenome]|uniref:JAB domain-containing protein n=1 Tax=marine sediment metagenome TaxID=412755 RepID=A0A0F9X5Y0_9ZZZZ
MNKPVGYLMNHPEGISGERGLYYNYIMASNGIFIEAESPLITARIPVTECEIRGLAPIETKISLLYGSIPQRFFDLALNMFLADIESEHYVAIVGDAGYHLHIPVQDKSAGGVVYEVESSVALEIHSHGHMGAWFSSIDNMDETGLKFYGVVGKLDATPIVKLRIGVYGYFKNLRWSEVFDGSLAGAVEYEKAREEVIPEDAVYDLFEEHGARLKDSSRWLWRNWKFRC